MPVLSSKVIKSDHKQVVRIWHFKCHQRFSSTLKYKCSNSTAPLTPIVTSGEIKSTKIASGWSSVPKPPERLRRSPRPPSHMGGLPPPQTRSPSWSRRPHVSYPLKSSPFPLLNSFCCNCSWSLYNRLFRCIISNNNNNQLNYFVVIAIPFLDHLRWPVKSWRFCHTEYWKLWRVILLTKIRSVKNLAWRSLSM